MIVAAVPQYPLDLMWREVREMARGTVGMDDLSKPVSDRFMREMISSMHSPIRELRFKVLFRDIPTFAAQHMSRHRIASICGTFELVESVNPVDVEHYVKTQRPDRTGEARGGQDAPVDYRTTANVQGLQDMSQKRLCFLAERPVRGRWAMARMQIATHDPIIARALVPTCVYRGFCPEARKCKERYDKTDHFKRSLDVHRSIIEAVQ
jgi:hypothetical protein